jgi:hypothetical protein
MEKVVSLQHALHKLKVSRQAIEYFEDYYALPLPPPIVLHGVRRLWQLKVLDSWISDLERIRKSRTNRTADGAGTIIQLAKLLGITYTTTASILKGADVKPMSILGHGARRFYSYDLVAIAVKSHYAKPLRGPKANLKPINKFIKNNLIIAD